MNCWTCDRPAHTVCKFCGRAVCKDNVKSMPAILAMFRGDDASLQALAEPDAVHCGICKPRGRPVRLDGLDGLETWAKATAPAGSPPAA